LNVSFLGWYVKTPRFFEQVAAQGSTNYAAIRPHHVLGYTIPLPSIAEQSRIVSQLNASAELVDSRTRVSIDVETELAKTLKAGFQKIAAKVPRVCMGDLCPLVRRPIEIDLEGQYPELGIRSFGKGTFHKAELSGFDVGTKRTNLYQEKKSTTCI
jgi:type I restriction enzyme S subunit